MIKIKETLLFGQIVTAVIDNAITPPAIIDIRKGEVSDHARTCARYHAKKAKQGMINIIRIIDADSFLPTVEKDRD